MKTLKTLVVANNANWSTLQADVDALRSWFSAKVNINFDITHTTFKPIPQEVIVPPSGIGVDNTWYDKNISSLALGYDIVLLLVNSTDWFVTGTKGFRRDRDLGPVELTVFAGEHESIYKGIDSTGPVRVSSTFYEFARHEILHALYMLTGQDDRTHYWRDQGSYERARDELVFTAIPVSAPKPPSIPDIAFAWLARMGQWIKAGMQGVMPAIPEEIKAQPTMPPEQPIVPKSNREKILETAKKYIGKDASPLDNVPDEVGCADSCSRVVNEAIGDFPIIVSTAALYISLKSNPRFKQSTELKAGSIIVSPTGYGNGSIRGHTGIIGDNEVIMSNDSATGQWQENYTIGTWVKRYRKVGGLPLYVFEPIG